MKMFNVLRAVAFAALFALIGLSGLRAAGFPQQISLNGVVGNTANGGMVFGAVAGASTATSISSTPLLLCNSPANCGWFESFLPDQAKGATATVQVIFYDATSTATCTSSAVVYTFTRLTGTPTLLGAEVAATNTAFVAPTRIDVDAFIHSNLYVALDSADASTFTGSVVLGKPLNAVNSLLR